MQCIKLTSMQCITFTCHDMGAPTHFAKAACKISLLDTDWKITMTVTAGQSPSHTWLLLPQDTVFGFSQIYTLSTPPLLFFCGFFFTQRACKVIKQVRQNLTRWSPYSGYCFTGVQRNLLFSPFINLFTNYESPHCSMESKNLLGELITGFQHPVNCAVSPQDVIF